MKLKLFLIFIIFSLIFNEYAICIDISGVINSYSSVTNIDYQNNTLTLQSVNGFKEGDKALIIQMKGADINFSNSASFGMIQSYNDCGNYEIVSIDKIAGSIIELKSKLLRQYNIQGIVQLVSVPVYDSVSITGELSCMTWNGKIGGILVLIVNGNINFKNDINVSGKGFTGAPIYPASTNLIDQQEYYFPGDSWKGAIKGEGIANIDFSMKSGRGPLSNGGGGGNNHNSGGGAGGNGGSGGKGGYAWNREQAGYSTDNGGLGGQSLSYNNALNKIFLAGGGGAGHNNASDNTATDGVAGGGIVIIIANSISGNGYKILSNGMDAAESGNDGAGGGGAGGTILLDVGKFNSSLNIEAFGGKGGNAKDKNLYNTMTGPGGGGGGGVVWFAKTKTPDNVNINVNGGASGKITNTNVSLSYSPSYGAEDGKPGLILDSLNIPQTNDLCEYDFEYPDFSSIDNLNLGEDAQRVDKFIRLTRTEIFRIGTAWYFIPVPVSGGFITSFSFRFTEGKNGIMDDGSIPGADGIAFVIQNHSNSALGEAGGGIGYSSIPNSMAVEFDTFNNDLSIDNIYDHNGNHAAVQSMGTEANTSNHSSTAKMALNDSIIPLIPDGRIFYAKIDYNVENNKLRVFLDSTVDFKKPILEVSNLELNKLLNLVEGTKAYVGFTSATGNAVENHDILDWHWCSFYAEPGTSVENENIVDIRNDFFAYPNPFSDNIKISFNNPKLQKVEIKIYNMLGILEQELVSSVLDEGIYNFEWQPNRTESGVYYCKLKTDDGEKIVKAIYLQ